MTTRIVFAGFRHRHLLDLYEHCGHLAEIEVVACSEEDPETRVALEAHDVQVTHHSHADLISEVECDVVAIGDVFGARGSLAVAALSAGRHVLSDKPLCTSLHELDRIEEEATHRGLEVGCMLDLRDCGPMIGLRDIVRSGEIGEVQAISVGGQHPLLLGQRPEWYFVPDLHGGVLNDIAVHAIDVIPWVTGVGIRDIVAARTWNASVPEHPDFEQCGHAMLTLENGAGVLCDVSYLAPDSFGYQLPLYWRLTIWGVAGVVEATASTSEITLYRNGEGTQRLVTAPSGRPGGYLDAFLDEVHRRPKASGLTTGEVLGVSRLALQLQAAAS